MSNASAHKEEATRMVWAYLIFICASTAFRSFETGIISSMMPDITTSLRLSYTKEGIVAASPDYGMIPGSLVAGFVFKHFRAHYVLMMGYAVTATVCFTNAFLGSMASLVFARAVGNFFWAFAVTHYPAWINTHGKKTNKTIMLALPSVMLLVGTVSGYFVGGLAASSHFASWTWLYGLEGALMGLCAVCSCLFDPELVSMVDRSSVLRSPDTESRERSTLENRTKAGPNAAAAPLLESRQPNKLQSTSATLWSRLRLPAEVVALLTSRVFIFTALAAATISGAGGLILYFVMQVGMQATGWSKRNFHLVSGAVMATSPLSGTITGAVILQRFGGYQNYSAALLFTSVSSLLILVSNVTVLICCLLRNNALWHYVFVAAFFSLTFFGAWPAAATNGVTVSVVPGTAHYASGLTFVLLHLVKLVVPIVGGWVIDSVGLLIGFPCCLIALAVMMFLCSLVAYRELKCSSSQITPQT